ncbi:sn-glycerol-3-phosphate import ATP-binding protein UgpC [Phycisphaerae bacterium RAS1]|nr:sn-glycerol-3-phosphate import ATP-binding protein UgpC [Phycisphaerae bacterium RAS1]
MTCNFISKIYGSLRALAECSLAASAGELVVLLGPSGCGKTTLLRIIAGLEAPDSGSVLFDGEDRTAWPPQKRNVAMVFQSYALYPHRTVRGNIEYPLRVAGIGRAERAAQAEEVARLLGIEKLLDRWPGRLSGGEAQRVALARALVRRPSCFLLDEPLSSLDAQRRVAGRAEIRRIQRTFGVTTVYVTHDQDDAVALADRIAVMNQGRVEQCGTPTEILTNPASVFVASFVGDPPMNLMPGRIRAVDAGVVTIELEGGGATELALQRCPTVYPGQCVTVGARPHEISIEAGSTAAERDTDTLAWNARVELVEGVEPDLVVHCASPGGIALVRAPRRPAGGDVRLSCSASALRFFDVKTGLRIDKRCTDHPA